MSFTNAYNTEISPNFLVSKFCGKVQFPKLCLSTKFPHQKISGNFGTFMKCCKDHKEIFLMMYSIKKWYLEGQKNEEGRWLLTLQVFVFIFNSRWIEKSCFTWSYTWEMSCDGYFSLRKKSSFPLRTSSVNVTKSADS